MNNIEKLTQILKESNNIVFFGGAGVSTESGIADFRGEKGLFMDKEKGWVNVPYTTDTRT